MLTRTITGGDVGVDIAALRAAKAVGLETGGWMARGWRTDAGTKPEYAEQYGVQQLDTPDRDARHIRNIRESNAVLLLARSVLSSDMKSALAAIRKPGDTRPYRIVEWGEYDIVRVLDTHRDAVVRFLLEPGRMIVSVVGGRDQFVEAPVQAWLEQVFREVQRLQ